MSEKSESEKEKSLQDTDDTKGGSAAVVADTTSESKVDETNAASATTAATSSQSPTGQPEESPSSVEQPQSDVESEKADQVETQQSEKSIDGNESQRDDGEESDQRSQTEETSSKTSTEQKTTASRGPVMRRRRKGEKVTEKNVRIGFIGAGKMTEVIVKGLLEVAPADGSERINPKQIFVASKSGKNHDNYKRLGCYVTKRSYDIFGRMDCDIVFLAVHGYVIRQCYKSGGIRPLALTTNFIPNQRHPLYILSLVGGIPLNDIKRTLLNPDHPEKYRVEMHRIMLNHSVAYGLGIGAIDVEPDSKHCAGIVRNILCRISRLETIGENHMDIACAAGGYGSTFCYYFMAAVADGAFKKGLPKHLATKIAARTLQSAAASIIESGKNPNDLRDACTSPSGPAIYGLHVLDKADCASGFAAAVEAAYQRIKELAENPPA